MLKKLSFNQDRDYIIKDIVLGALVGGLLGAIVGFLNKIAVLPVPKLESILAIIPFSITMVGTILGIFIGGAIGSVLALYTIQGKSIEYSSYMDDGKITKLQLREEQLDIAKKWIKTGEVAIHKEVFTEEKNITVPVTREELVIEKKVLDEKNPDKNNRHTDKIRIPISEERIEITKHPIVLEDVSIYKHQFQETKCVEKNLKKEKIHLETMGNPKIKNK